MEIYKVVDSMFGTIYSRELFTNKLHCEDGPAIIYTHGGTEWYQHGELHRIDGPAIVEANGKVCWYLFDSKTCKSAHDEFKLALEQHLSGKDIKLIPYDVLKEIYERSLV